MKKKQNQNQKRKGANLGVPHQTKDILPVKKKCPICKMKWEDDHDQDSE